MKVRSVKVRVKPAFGAAIASGAKDFLCLAAEKAEKVLIISDDAVCKLYGQSVKKALGNDNLTVFTFVYSATENGKTKYIFDKLLILMTELDMGENDLIVALGGGTAFALAGFAAAVYNGGVPYVNLPTTLFAMSGACIDGEVGVDFLGRENLLCATNYPKAVFCDTEFLKTLEHDPYSHGMAEIIRSALVGDRRVFDMMSTEAFTIEEGICSALKIKAAEKSEFPFSLVKSKNLRLGEPFIKAVRIVSHYLATEGEALALGTLIAAEVSESLGECLGVAARLTEVYDRLGVKYEVGVKKQDVLDYVLSDEKIRKDGLEFVIIKQAGSCAVKKFDYTALSEVELGR